MKKIAILLFVFLNYFNLYSQSLIDAVLDRDYYAVSVLANPENINKPSEEYGFTPMMYATHNGDIEIVKLLASRGAKLDIQEKRGWAVIHFAALKQPQILIWLIENGANINIKTNDGWTPLMIIANNYNEEIYSFMANKGASEKIKNKDGKTAKDILNEYLQSTRYLQSQALNYADHGDYCKAIEYLKEVLIITKKDSGEYSKVYAYQIGLLSAIHRLNKEYEKAFQLNIKAIGIFETLGLVQTDLYSTVINYLGILYHHSQDFFKADSLFLRSIEIVEKYYGRNHNYAFYINNYCELKIDKGEYLKAESLILESLNILKNLNNEGTVLHARLLNNLGQVYFNTQRLKKAKETTSDAMNIVKKLSSENHPYYLQFSNNFKRIEQSLVSEKHKEEIVKIVIPSQNIVDTINKKDETGATPLMFAVNSGDINKVKPLVEQGALLNLQDTSGIAAIHIACLFGYWDILFYLIESGADINIKTNENYTPLITMAEYNFDEEIYKKLIEYGADETVVNNDGKTARDYADEFLSSINYLKNKANYHYSLGEYDLAVSFYQKVSDKTKLDLGENTEEYALTLITLTNLYTTIGKYDKAFDYGLQAIKIFETLNKTNDANYANALNNKGLIYYYQRDFRNAEETYLKAIGILEQNNDKKNLSYSTYLQNLSLIYMATGKFLDAEKFILEAIKIIEEIGQNNGPNYSRYLNNLATIYISIGKYNEAENLFQNSLEIITNIYGDSHPEYAMHIGSYALLKKMKGDYSDAEKYYLKAKLIFDTNLGKQNPYSISIDNQLADLYAEMGLYNKSLSLYFDLLEISQNNYGDNSLEYSSILYSLSELYRQNGDFNKAKSYVENAIQIQENVIENGGIQYAKSVNTLGMLEAISENYIEAEKLYKKAIDIIEFYYGTDHSEYAQLLNNLAQLYQNIGDFRKATELYYKAKGIIEKSLGKSNRIYSLLLNNIGILNIESGKYKEAEELFKEALDINKVILGENHLEYALVLGNLGYVYKLTFQVKVAEVTFQNAIEAFEKIEAESHPYYSYSLTNLGLLYFENKKYEKALDLFKKSLSISEKSFGKDNFKYAQSLHNLGLLMFYMDKDVGLTDSIIYASNNALVKQLERSFAFAPESEKEYFYDKLIGAIDLYKYIVYKKQKEKPSLSTIAYKNELALKGAQLNSTVRMRHSIMQSKNEGLKKQFDVWLNLKEEINYLVNIPINERRTNLDSLKNIANDLEKELARNSKEFMSFQSTFDIKWEDAKNNLKDNEAAIEFINFQYDGSFKFDSIIYCALVITNKSKYPTVVYLTEEKELKDILPNPSNSNQSEYNLSYMSSRGVGTLVFDDSNYKGDMLYNKLWCSIDSLLKGIETIYFSPSGLLHTVNFAAIPAPDGELLIEKYNLNQVSSTRLLAIKEEPISNKDVVIFGGIDYSYKSDMDNNGIDSFSSPLESNSIFRNYFDRHQGFSYLEGTYTEAITLSNLLDNKYNTKIFTGFDATEDLFKQMTGATSPSIIHIATHGFYIPDTISSYQSSFALTGFDSFSITDDPLMRSALVFAGANYVLEGNNVPYGFEDGILTAREVSNLNLSNTNLVVLSACQTGLGDVAGNEGVIGLQRAFKMAGVRYLIMSLWSVPDKETKEFMINFYQNWLSGRRIREAFRDTQLFMYNKYPNEPFKWAGFVLTE